MPSRLVIVVFTAFVVMLAGALAPALSHATPAKHQVVSVAGVSQKLPCHSALKGKAHCPGGECLDLVACLAKCTQSLALIDAPATVFQTIWGTTLFVEPTASMCSRSIPPLLRPPSI